MNSKNDAHNIYIHALSDSDVKLGMPVPPAAK